MQSDNKILDDITKVTSSAIGTIFNAKKEVDAIFKHNVERMLSNLDVVPRSEFEAVKEMAAKARSKQEDLEKKVKELEKKLASEKTPSKPSLKAVSSGSPAKKKPAAKKSSTGTSKPKTKAAATKKPAVKNPAKKAAGKTKKKA